MWEEAESMLGAQGGSPSFLCRCPPAPRGQPFLPFLCPSLRPPPSTTSQVRWGHGEPGGMGAAGQC